MSFLSNTYNTSNSCKEIDFRFINDVQQIYDFIRAGARGTVALYLNKNLKQAVDQIVRLWFLAGGPYKTSSELIEDVFMKVVEWWIKRQSSELMETKTASEIDEESQSEPELIFFETRITHSIESNERKAETEGPKCHFCGNSAEKIFVFKPNGKRYPACSEHAKKLAEFPDKWEVLEEEGSTICEKAPLKPEK